ncbi:MAG: hypothetical protein E7266_08370 [Lachnospiraceae bacterium]|nr:hypothetical protein [Lachnospiraceae bacterium]
MKPEEMIEAVGGIKDDFIEAADRTRIIKKRFPWKKVIAAAACVCVVSVGIAVAVGVFTEFWKKTDDVKNPYDTDNYVGSVESDNKKYLLDINNMEKISEKFVLTEAVYPTMTAYPTGGSEDKELYKAWQKDVQKQLNQYEGYSDGMSAYYSKIIRSLMSDSKDENVVCSPLSVYLALSMLAEVSDGSSRQQVLDVIGVETTEELQKKVAALWNANYRTDGRQTSLLANSLWLKESFSFNQSTLKTLSDSYYASVYSGNMADSGYVEAYRTWINNHTAGLLKDSVEQMNFSDPNLCAVMASTLYFSAKWYDKFDEEDTVKDMFYGTKGITECEFLTKDKTGMLYYKDKDFSTVWLPFNEGGEMILILPDVDSSVEKVLASKTFMEVVTTPFDAKKTKKVNLKIPKFDVSSNMSIKENIKKLGITDVFMSLKSDFSDMELSVSEISHSARVKINEEGCEASAVTVIYYDYKGVGIEKPIDFIADRPFIFVIKGAGDAVLFTGVVNNPQN